MGADGHIQIYSMEKLKVKYKYDDEIIKSFFDHFGSATMYRQSLDGKEYITRYWGDNLDGYDMYDVVLSCYCPENDEFSTGSYAYDKYSAEYFMKLPKKQRKQFHEFVTYMENECRLTNWEVWT